MGRTVRVEVTQRGVGLHSGRPCEARVAPAAPGAGLTLNGAPLATLTVQSTARATCVGTPTGSVSTVEHLLGALVGLGVTDAAITVIGPEVPILDGSAAPWVRALTPLEQGGTQAWSPPRPVRVGAGERWIQVTPAPSLHLTVVAHHPPAPAWRVVSDLSDFATAVAPARTYVFLRDVPALRAAGLAQGGALDNALVLTDDGEPVAGALRLPDEPARHKALDLLGDLALLGRPLAARVEASRPGHGLNQRLVAALRALA